MVPPPDAAVNVAVPELLVPDVAVNELTLVAFAVAPELTTSTSLSVPKSVIVSVPESTLKVSFPALPVKLSLLAPPVIVSFPAPPIMISLPPAPVIISLFDPPVKLSTPAFPARVNPPSPELDISTVLPPATEFIVAVPEFLVAEVAVKELTFVAFAVAPELTTSMSLPVPRSVIVSVPESTLNVSFPELQIVKQLLEITYMFVGLFFIGIFIIEF